MQTDRRPRSESSPKGNPFSAECILAVTLRTSLMAVLLALTLWQTCLVQAHETEWKKLDGETRALYRLGNYDQAVVVAVQALSVAEETFGSDHPYLA